jgi:hypothetical protein
MHACSLSEWSYSHVMTLTSQCAANLPKLEQAET